MVSSYTSEIHSASGSDNSLPAFSTSPPGSSIISNDTALNNTYTNFGNAPAASPFSQVNLTSSSSPYAGTLQIPYTGLTSYHVTPITARLFGLDENTYAMIITAVEPGSPAAKAGIRGGNMTTNVSGEIIKVGGDIILGVDGNTSFVRNNEAFLNYLENEKRVGENITFSILRDGKIKEVPMTIGAMPRFLWYENKDEGIKMKYPSDWRVSESDLSKEDIVKFYSPESSVVNNSTLAAAGVFVKIRPSNDIGLDALASAEQDDTANTRHLDISLTSISNLPAYETIFYDYSNTDRTLKILSAFTIKDGQIYRINFATDPPKYDDYLAPTREMIKSFQFTK